MLWQLQQEGGEVLCLMRSCCTGAELQVLVREGDPDTERIVVREMYPTKSDLYERARQLEQDYRNARPV